MKLEIRNRRQIMSLLRNNSDTFDAQVFYVFDEDGELRVLNEEIDLDIIKKSTEEKEKMDDDDLISAASDIPFNQPANLKNYEEEDIRKATFSFRRPRFDDMPVLLSSFVSVNASGDIAPGDIFEFSNRKLKLLFVKGKAQDVDGKEVKITEDTLGQIPPVLGTAMSVKMATVLNM
ncbi:hypothetical protein KY325_04050 [Candidatus Woesearchaeota archaeon]|nr:hypothetical protein [Candidatus Woesearchaeota archaeon]